MPSTPISSLLPDLTGYSVDDGSIHLLNILGVGAYGKVYKAWDSRTKAYVAVKCMPTYELGSRTVEMQNAELELHTMLSDHVSVVTLIRQFVEDHLVFVVLELCPGGDLHGGLFRHRCFHGNARKIKKVFGEILDAVDHLHQLGVSHRDIKPKNILCDEAGTNIRLTDFGMSTREAWSDHACGTRMFMSPESLNHARESYSTRQSDLWALGVMFAIVVSQCTPWDSAWLRDEDFAAFCDNAEYLYHVLPGITQPTFELLEWCFCPDASKRPTLAEFRDAMNAIDCFVVPPTHVKAASPTLTGEWDVAPLSADCEKTPRPASVPVFAPQLPAPTTWYSESCSASAIGYDSSSSSDSWSRLPLFTSNSDTTCSIPPTSPVEDSTDGSMSECVLAPVKPPKCPPLTRLPTCCQFILAKAKN
ncbi:kinase-like domain-containing protein [Roridomyces roridus]|uniref:Kinase-like domain-containing protein n=1 Tax=Roridomyces roridus TaxID=1738132 RepID=A0AAD7FRM6_9AGAR|nr:kinase-like domain-containing protein [Roridomyces roridus]